ERERERETRYVGSSSREKGATFYALGSFNSNYLGQEVFGGIKKIRKKSKEYFMWSLGNLLFMKKIYPDIESLLPLYFGAVQKEDEYEIVMEDYSQNKKRIVSENEDDYDLIPVGLHNYVESVVDLTSNFGSFIGDNKNREIKLMDFNTVFWNDDTLEKSFRFRWSLEKDERRLETFIIHQ
ncbi:MAG: hypothetical protein AABX16_02695, partial [Nanoarchaeota archaeon]